MDKCDYHFSFPFYFPLKQTEPKVSWRHVLRKDVEEIKKEKAFTHFGEDTQEIHMAVFFLLGFFSCLPETKERAEWIGLEGAMDREKIAIKKREQLNIHVDFMLGKEGLWERKVAESTLIMRKS